MQQVDKPIRDSLRATERDESDTNGRKTVRRSANRYSPVRFPLFGGVNERLSLDLVQAKSTESGRVIVTYRT
jgi:hypothetical protein